MSATTDIHHTARDEIFEVTVWRQEQIELAFEQTIGQRNRELAARLAHEHHVDLHKLVKTIEDGCPPDLVRAIFT